MIFTASAGLATVNLKPRSRAVTIFCTISGRLSMVAWVAVTAIEYIEMYWA